MTKAEKSLFDMILDAENMIDKVKDLELTRLTKKFGKKFVVKIESLTEEQVNSCYDSKEGKLDFVLESVKIEGKSLKDKVLLDKFGVKIARDVVTKIFNNGEIGWLYVEVLKLNGLDGGAVIELKN